MASASRSHRKRTWGFERGRYANANIVARHRHAYKDGARTHGERPSLEGAWTVMSEYVKSHGSSLYMPYMAGEVNIVMDANGNEAVEVEILRNGKMVPYTVAGDDVSFVQNKSVVRVDAPRMYRLLNAPNREEGVLELRVTTTARDCTRLRLAEDAARMQSDVHRRSWAIFRCSLL